MSDQLSDPASSGTSEADSSTPSSPILATPPNLHQNTTDPAAKWLVQKYGGTSVGKFAVQIAEDIVPQYLDQHKLAIVCSARSGSTKALGTTNLLVQAAEQAVSSKHRRSISNGSAGSPGTFTPLSTFWGSSNKSPTSTPARVRADSAQASPGPKIDPTPSSFYSTVDLIRQEHVTAARASIHSPEILEELELEIEQDCESLKCFLAAAQVIDEISPRSKDSIIGVGEKLACKLIAAILRDRSIDSEYVALDNICPPLPPQLQYSSSYSSSNANLPQEYYDMVSEAVAERVRACNGRIPVVTGFFAPLPPPASLMSTVGRGYTDLLAALLTSGLGASELQIWKEVDGIFTADPRKVMTARLLPIITPEEAAELTFFGSEVVHPFTMEQVMRKSIPIRIKNVENPQGGGTVILPNVGGEPHRGRPLMDASDDYPLGRVPLPTAVTYKDNIVVINVNSNRKSVSHGFLAGIFREIDRFGITVDLISTSEVQVSMAIQVPTGESVAIPNATISLSLSKIDRLVRELGQFGTVSIHRDMAILSLVGAQMASLVGISGRMFTTLGEGGINIEMISQGASEINISCVIKGRDAVKAVNLIHQSCLQIMPNGTRGRVGPWLF